VPPLVRRYIKTSFLFFILGLAVGAVNIITWGFLDRPIPHLMVTAHAHLLLVGFVLMMIMGVATWMFPRPAKEDERYRPGLVAVIYWLITLATSIRFLAEVVTAYRPSPGLKPVIALGGLGQILAALLFSVNMWSRVRAPSIMKPE
jgi:cbb3-type cytochrome oxidase subunit 1